MNDTELREEICRVGRSLFERRYVHATAGNISARLKDGFLITPSDASLGFLQPERLAWVDAEGVQRAGDRASKTLTLHRCIYEAEPTAQCILHTHSISLVALTLAGVWSPEDIVPPITPYYVMKVGHVPLIPYHRPGHPEVAELISAAIHRSRQRDSSIRAVMLDRLGPVVWHRSPGEAMATLEELEETAHLWTMVHPKPSPLDESAIDELRKIFNAAW